MPGFGHPDLCSHVKVAEVVEVAECQNSGTAFGNALLLRKRPGKGLVVFVVFVVFVLQTFGISRLACSLEASCGESCGAKHFFQAQPGAAASLNCRRCRKTEETKESIRIRSIIQVFHENRCASGTEICGFL